MMPLSFPCPLFQYCCPEVHRSCSRTVSLSCVAQVRLFQGRQLKPVFSRKKSMQASKQVNVYLLIKQVSLYFLKIFADMAS